MSEYEPLARNVVTRVLQIKPQENVIVETWNHGLPIATELIYQLRSVGARPLLLLEDEATYWRSVTTLPEKKLGQVGTHEWKALEEADAYIFITGPADIRKIREYGIEKYEAATAYNDEWYRRARKARIRGARIGLGYVTPERASAYGLDPEAWKTMMVGAGGVDPSLLSKGGSPLKRLLSGRGHLEITASNGTHLSFDLAGRKARLDAGVFSEDLRKEGEVMIDVPSGEVYVAPEEKSVEGTIVFDRPIQSQGRWVRDVAFSFKNGRATLGAGEGEELLRPSWERAKGDKNRLGLVSFGLNPEARTGFLQDYLVAGNVYVAVGGNQDYGGRNRSPYSLGATLSGATVTIDETVVVKHGALV